MKAIIGGLRLSQVSMFPLSIILTCLILLIPSNVKSAFAISVLENINMYKAEAADNINVKKVAIPIPRYLRVIVICFVLNISITAAGV
jgi:hypothetical protein